MALNPFIIEKNVGRIPYQNEAVLSNWFEKKAITIDYDFPGVKQYGRLGQSSSLGIVPKNSVYFRQSDSPYKYRPLVMIIIYGSDGQNLTVRTVDIPKLIKWNVENVSITSFTGELVRVWDNSAKQFMNATGDENRYISSVTYNSGQTNSTIHLSGSLATSVEATKDYIGLSAGLEDFENYVIVDEEVNFRDDRRPKPHTSDVYNSALYRCRVNTDKISQWRDWSDNFKKQIRLQSRGIFWDFE